MISSDKAGVQFPDSEIVFFCFFGARLWWRRHLFCLFSKVEILHGYHAFCVVETHDPAMTCTRQSLQSGISRNTDRLRPVSSLYPSEASLMQQRQGDFPLDVDGVIYMQIEERRDKLMIGHNIVYTSHPHHPHQPNDSLKASLLLIESRQIVE